MTKRSMGVALAGLLTMMAATGCHIQTSGNGDKNVAINTPFGGVAVKTDDAANVAAIGITPYPGATLAPKNDGNNGSADVNLSFGKFQVRVLAASYRTADDPAKVQQFYGRDLARYGTVIVCRGDQPVGQPTRTAEGLTCSDQHGSHSSSGSHDSDLQLRAGSERHQHIVGITPKGSYTEIGLVALELPRDITAGAASE